MISAVEFQTIPNIQTGNLLIDEYGQNDPNIDGENGRGIFLSEKEDRNISAVLNKYKINILASDIIPLNRMVPDSRSPGQVLDCLNSSEISNIGTKIEVRFKIDFSLFGVLLRSFNSTCMYRPICTN
jgi:hypothetical protein